jgi:aminoglycoside 6'-N-acetyltransferase
MVMVRSVSTADDIADEATGAAFAFRPLTEGDLRLLHAWLNEPGVAPWWTSEDLSWEGVLEEHTKSIRGEEPLDEYIAWFGGRPVGWIQTYAIDDDPDYAEVIAATGLPTDGLAGVDYLLGDPADRGRGLGARMIRAFLDEVVFGEHPAWTSACAGPDPANQRSVRVLEKAGFRFVGDIVSCDGPEHLMVIDRTIAG